jgi:hypothetical protein
MKKILYESNQQTNNFVSSTETVINYGSGFSSDFLTSYDSGSTSQKVTVPTVPVPVPQRWFRGFWIQITEPEDSQIYANIYDYR